jgi:hypothetical protein
LHHTTKYRDICSFAWHLHHISMRTWWYPSSFQRNELAWHQFFHNAIWLTW